MTPRSPATTGARLGALAILLVLGGCSPERLRPGPPSITLQLPLGPTATSPDTIGVRVRASDPNGLDTVSVALREIIVTLNVLAQTEFEEVVFLPIPSGVDTGSVLTIIGTASDLSGFITQTSESLTVVANPPSP